MSSVNARVALEVGRVVEALVEHEVQVAVLGVAEDHAAPRSRAGRTGRSGPAQVASSAGTGTATSSSSAVVPLGPGAGDGGVQALADVPERGARGRVAAERAGAASVQLGRAIGRPRATRSSSASAVGCLALDQQRGVLARRAAARQRRRRPRVGAGPPAGTRRRAARSVATPASTRSGSAPVAAAGRGRPAARWRRAGSAGTVRNVASATKPSVPSLPTTRWARMSIGSVWSRKALRP